MEIKQQCSGGIKKDFRQINITSVDMYLQYLSHVVEALLGKYLLNCLQQNVQHYKHLVCVLWGPRIISLHVKTLTE